MSYLAIRQQLKGQLAEYEEQKVPLEERCENAVLILSMKVNAYEPDFTRLETNAIRRAAADLDEAADKLREINGHIDNIKRQLNG